LYVPPTVAHSNDLSIPPHRQFNNPTQAAAALFPHLQVQQAHEATARWDGVAAALPALVERLQALQALHTKSFLFSSRMARVETEQAAVAQLLTDLGAQLTAVVSGEVAGTRQERKCVPPAARYPFLS
jgi:Dynamitin